MSNFTLTAKDKKTGKMLNFLAYDDYFGKHHYGYRQSGVVSKVWNQKDFDENFEVIS